MSVEAITAVLHHSKARGTAKLVLIGIANHQGDNGAWPSISTLGKYAGGVHRRNVSKAIADLIDMGEIACFVNGAPSNFSTANLYQVLVSCPPECDGTMNHRRKRVDENAIGGHGENAMGGMTKTSTKPKENQNLKTNTCSSTDERVFNEFWKAYPRKVGKAAAMKAFEKASAGSQSAEIIAGAVALANDPNLPPTAFVPHPATWLNREGWLDEPYPERPLSVEEKAAKDKAEKEARWERERETRKREAEEREAERKRYEAELAANPVPKCEHGRVLYLCRPCSTKQQIN